MTSTYYKQLDDVSKARYLEKLTHNGESLPDPLDEIIQPYAFSNNIKLWPSINFGDVYMYLVETECTYTKESFRNYKALDCYNYVLSGKVHNILAYKNQSLNVCVLTWDVQASQSLKTHHKPWIVTLTNGVVCSGHCTCMAGLGEVCSHVAALLLALEIATREGLQSPSPTSVSCVWNKLVKEVKPSAAVEINFYHKRTNPYKRPCVALQMPSTSAYDTFLEVIKENQPNAAILTMLSDEDTSTASETEKNTNSPRDKAPLMKENIPNLVDFYHQLSVNIPDTVSEGQRLSAFMRSSTFPAHYIADVECSTRKQEKDPNWFYYRQGRITASLFGRVVHCIRGHKGLVSTIMQTNKPFCNNAMKYGQTNEETAKRKLKEYLEEQHVNVELVPTGFMVDKEYGFLGATPDGMVVCDCCDSALVEVKCPARGKGLKLKDIQTKNFFLDEDLNLRQNHNYYDQVQGQMDIWNVNRCYFVTHTDVETHIQIVEYDSEYWNVQKPNLITFFKEHVLREIIKKISDE